MEKYTCCDSLLYICVISLFSFPVNTCLPANVNTCILLLSLNAISSSNCVLAYSVCSDGGIRLLRRLTSVDLVSKFDLRCGDATLVLLG